MGTGLVDPILPSVGARPPHAAPHAAPHASHADGGPLGQRA